MYSINISTDPITATEKSLFNSHLSEMGLDDNLWDIYEKFLQSTSTYTKPLVVRIKKNNEVMACMFVLECKDYGPTLSKYKFIKRVVRMLSIPVTVWMKAGIAAEIFANPVFLNKAIGNDQEVEEVLNLLRKKSFMLFIHDLKDNASHHGGSVMMPYPDEGVLDTSAYATIQDYLADHRNLKKKLRKYRKEGGIVEIVKGALDDQAVEKIKECVISTGERSVFKLPYQNDYPDMCAGSASITNEKIIHFLCNSDDVFYGYHSFIQFKDQIRCLNGAFNRNLATTHHAYENMIYRVAEYAIDNKIHTVYFGPTLNETKKRMMNKFLQTELYVSSNQPWLLKLFAPVLRGSRLNSPELLKFSGIQSG